MKIGMHFLFAMVVFLGVICVGLTYLWLDRSISLSYSDQGAELTGKAFQGMKHLLRNEWIGLPEEKIMEKLKKASTEGANAELILKPSENAAYFQEVRFEFENHRLKSIE